jgi:hypothetical protein
VLNQRVDIKSIIGTSNELLVLGANETGEGGHLKDYPFAPVYYGSFSVNSA